MFDVDIFECLLYWGNYCIVFTVKEVLIFSHLYKRVCSLVNLSVSLSIGPSICFAGAQIIFLGYFGHGEAVFRTKRSTHVLGSHYDIHVWSAFSLSGCSSISHSPCVAQIQHEIHYKQWHSQEASLPDWAGFPYHEVDCFHSFACSF